MSRENEIYDEYWQSPDGSEFVIQHTAPMEVRLKFREAMEKSGWIYQDSRFVKNTV